MSAGCSGSAGPAGPAGSAGSVLTCRSIVFCCRTERSVCSKSRRISPATFRTWSVCKCVVGVPVAQMCTGVELFDEGTIALLDRPAA